MVVVYCFRAYVVVWLFPIDVPHIPDGLPQENLHRQVGTLSIKKISTKSRGLRLGHGSVISQPFRKFFTTDKLTNQPTDRPTNQPTNGRAWWVIWKLDFLKRYGYYYDLLLFRWQRGAARQIFCLAALLLKVAAEILLCLRFVYFTQLK